MENEVALFKEYDDLAEYQQSFEENVKVLIDRIKETGEEEISLEQNHFAPGVYARELFIPKGQIIVGAVHKTEHLNIVASGKVSVATRDGILYIEAPCVLKSEVGIQKVAIAHENTVWITIHPTEETDVDKLVSELVEEVKV